MAATSTKIGIIGCGNISGIYLENGKIFDAIDIVAVADIDIDRAEGFDKNVTLEATYSHLNTIFGSSLPEGVTVDAKASNTLLTSGATKGKIVLKAESNALPVEKQQIVVMANISLNFVMKATYASKPILLSIESGTLKSP